MSLCSSLWAGQLQCTWSVVSVENLYSIYRAASLYISISLSHCVWSPPLPPQPTPPLQSDCWDSDATLGKYKVENDRGASFILAGCLTCTRWVPASPPVRLTWIFDTWRPVSAALTSHKVTLCFSDSGQWLGFCGGGEAQKFLPKNQQQQQQTLVSRERLREGCFPQKLFVSHSLFMSSHQSRGQHTIAKLGDSLKKHSRRNVAEMAQ